MPTYVDPQACHACAGVELGPLCVYICPNDLMVLDPRSDKGFNQEPEMCSECYACVKLCPQEAIHVRGYADFVPLGAEVQPRYVEGEIHWSIRWRLTDDALLRPCCETIVSGFRRGRRDSVVVPQRWHLRRQAHGVIGNRAWCLGPLCGLVAVRRQCS